MTDFLAQIDAGIDPALFTDLVEAQDAYDAARTQLEEAQRDLAAHLQADKTIDPLAWTLTNRTLTDLIATLESIVSAKAEPLGRLRLDLAKQRRRAAWHLHSELSAAVRSAHSEVAKQKAAIERQMAEALAALAKGPSSPVTLANADLAALHRACRTLRIEGYESMVFK